MCLTKGVYINGLHKPHPSLSGVVLGFFSPFCPYCSVPHTRVTQTSRVERIMVVTAKITLTARALSAFLMLSGRDVNLSDRISFKAAQEVVIPWEI